MEAFINNPIKEVSFGENHGASITTTGEAFFWGYSLIDFGKNDSLLPTKIQLLTKTNFIQISCGDFHIVLLSDKGIVFTMGSGINGQLGLGNKESKEKINEVKILNNIIQISCGKFHVMAISDNGLLYCWGDNQKYQLALPQYRKDVFVPVQVLAFENQSILQLISGGFTSGAIVSPG